MHPLPLDHHRQKINLLRRVGHVLPRSPPASPNRKARVMRRPARFHLHSPQPPQRIQNHVIALVIGKRPRHAKPPPRRLQHELHLPHLSHMLAVVPPSVPSRVPSRVPPRRSSLGRTPIPPTPRHMSCLPSHLARRCHSTHSSVVIPNEVRDLGFRWHIPSRDFGWRSASSAAIDLQN